MAKFNLLTVLTLNAAGFTDGINRSKKEAKQLEEGISAAKDSVKTSFSEISSAISPASEQMYGLTAIAGGVVKSFKSLIPAIKSVKVAIMSTGIGAIIIGISSAIAGLISWLKRTKEGSDTFDKVMMIIRNTISVTLEKIAHLGKAIVNLFKGDFKGAFQEAKNAVTGWGRAIKEAVDEGKKLAEIEDKLEDVTNENIKVIAMLESKMSEANYKMRDTEESTLEDRKKALNEYKKLALEIYKNKLKEVDLELKLAEAEYKHASTDENLKKVNEVIAKRYQLNEEYNDTLREIVRLQKQINDAFRQYEEKVRGGALEKLNANLDVEIDNLSQIDDLITNLNVEPPDSVAFDKISYSIATLKNELKSISVVNELVSGTFNNLSEAIVQWAETGKMSAKELVSEILNALRQLIVGLFAKSLADVISNALSPNPQNIATGGLWGLAAAAAGITAVTALWNKIPKFSFGGIIGGDYYSGDKIIAGINSGEMILNKTQQSNLFKLLNSGFGAGEVTFRIRGDELVGVLENHKKKIGRL